MAEHRLALLLAVDRDVHVDPDLAGVAGDRPADVTPGRELRDSGREKMLLTGVIVAFVRPVKLMAADQPIIKEAII